MAKTAAETMMNFVLEMRRKVVCLLVHCEVSIQLSWNERWIHCAFNDPTERFDITEQLNFPNLYCEEKVKTLLHSYFYSPVYSGQLSEEERCRVLTTPALLQALLAKFVQADLTDWHYSILALPPSRQSFVPAALAAYEQTGFEALVQIVRAIEQLQAFPSFFTEEEAVQALWTESLLALDLSAPLKKRAAGWKLKVPFTALEYEQLRTGIQLEPDTYYQSSLGRSLIKRFADRLQQSPKLQDLYLEDLAALSLGESCFDPDFSLAVARTLVEPSSEPLSDRVTKLLSNEGMLSRLCGKCQDNDLQFALREALSQSAPQDHKTFVESYFKEMGNENKYLYTLEGNSFIAINCLTLTAEARFSLLQTPEEAQNRTALLLASGLVLFTGGCVRKIFSLLDACNHSFTVSQRYLVHTGKLKQPRYSHGAIEVVDQVFVFGGQGSEKLASAEQLIGTEWKSCGQMHYPRTKFNPCCWGQLVYIVGGYQSFMEIFDPATLEFTVVEVEVHEASTSLAIVKEESELLVLFGEEWRLYHLGCSVGPPVSAQHSLSAVWSSCSPVILPALEQVYILEETGKGRNVKWVNWKTNTFGSAQIVL